MIMDCTLHDYLEVACLFHYKVRVTLTDGSEYEGMPQTTAVNQDKVEVLCFKTLNGEDIELPLALLHTMDVLTENARFQRIDF